MKVRTSNYYPYMVLEMEPFVINGMYTNQEIKDLIAEVEDLLDTLKWAENVTSN